MLAITLFLICFDCGCVVTMLVIVFVLTCRFALQVGCFVGCLWFVVGFGFDLCFVFVC